MINRISYVAQPGRIAYREEQVPVAGPGEAVVRVAYTGICGSDVHIYEGLNPEAKQNVVLGHEYSGIIHQIAPGSKNPNGLKVGTKVVGWIVEPCGTCEACIAGHTNVCRHMKCYGTQIDGTFRNFMTVPLHMLYKLPDDADLRLYALVEPMAVAVYAVRETPVLLGDGVFVIGGGPIGICTALAAKQAGARRVVVAEIEEEKIARIRSLGLGVINPLTCDARATAMEMTGGRGFECVMEATASASGYELMTKVGSFCAKGMNIGVSRKPVPLIPREIMVNEMYIKSIRIHQQSVFGITVELFAQADEAFCGSLYQLISHDYDFEHINDAFSFCVNDKSRCKVMIKVMED